MVRTTRSFSLTIRLISTSPFIHHRDTKLVGASYACIRVSFDNETVVGLLTLLQGISRPPRSVVECTNAPAIRQHHWLDSSDNQLRRTRHLLVQCLGDTEILPTLALSTTVDSQTTNQSGQAPAETIEICPSSCVPGDSHSDLDTTYQELTIHGRLHDQRRRTLAN